jgi:hypothetical protein
MVAILSLAVAGLATASTQPSAVTTLLTAMALMTLAAFSPWALLRLLPFTEIAAGARAMLRQDIDHGIDRARKEGGSALDVAAGLTVDPMMAGLDGLRRWASGGAAGSDSRGGAAAEQLSVLGGGSEQLPHATHPDLDEPSEAENSGGGQPTASSPDGNGPGPNILPGTDGGHETSADPPDGAGPHDAAAPSSIGGARAAAPGDGVAAGLSTGEAARGGAAVRSDSPSGLVAQPEDDAHWFSYARRAPTAPITDSLPFFDGGREADMVSLNPGSGSLGPPENLPAGPVPPEGTDR